MGFKSRRDSAGHLGSRSNNTRAESDQARCLRTRREKRARNKTVVARKVMFGGVIRGEGQIIGKVLGHPSLCRKMNDLLFMGQIRRGVEIEDE